MEQKLKPRRIITAIITGVVIYSALHNCISRDKRELPYADKTPAIRESESFFMTHSTTIDSLYLNVYESCKKKDNGRQITFRDYGFDGNLDEILIRQDARKDYATTNPKELSQWQPSFEKMRKRRLGTFKKD